MICHRDRYGHYEYGGHSLFFADMFKSFGAELPLMTRILLATSDFFHY